MHLGHHLLAVRFHRGLARAQLARDLLVEQPGHHTCHHVPLPRGERVKPAAQGCLLRLLRTRIAVAGELGTSEATVKTHRKQVMAKMRAESLADLIRIADQLDLLPPKS